MKCATCKTGESIYLARRVTPHTLAPRNDEALTPFCGNCWYKSEGWQNVADAPRQMPDFTPKPTPKAISVHKTREVAEARADRVEFYLGQRPAVIGSDASGHQVIGDSPLVPGFTGKNPHAK
jgi:hypothetical protein